MHKVTTTSELKEKIITLEYKQKEQWIDLKNNLNIAMESLKPVNLIKSTYRDLLSTPNMAENLIGSTIGLSTGFITRKLIVKKSGNVLRNLVGGLAQMIISNYISRHSAPLKSIGSALIHRFLLRKKSAPLHV